MSPQQQMVPERKRKKKSKAKVEFDAGKVFDPAQGKEEELELDPEMGRYEARKGQGGDRRRKK